MWHSHLGCASRRRARTGHAVEFRSAGVCWRSWTPCRLGSTGVSLFALARRMGTSLQMIDQTYGHLAPDADDYELGLLDAYDARKFFDPRTYFGRVQLRKALT